MPKGKVWKKNSYKVEQKLRRMDCPKCQMKNIFQEGVSDKLGQRLLGDES